MKRERQRRPAWMVWLVAAGGLVLIGLGQGLPNRDSIEQSLTRRSTAALEAAGVSGAHVTFVGRDGALLVPTKDVARAGAIVEGVEGVRVVSVRAVDVPVKADPVERVTVEQPEIELPEVAVRRGLAGLAQITFEDDSATLTPAGQVVVAKVADILKVHPGAKVRIEGHTDGNGTAQSNLVLSQTRARTVLDALVALGVTADRLVAAGFGETRHRVPDISPENRAVNRRVEFVVVG